MNAPPPSTGAARIVIRLARTSDVEALAGVFEEYRAFYRRASEPTAVKEFLAQRLANNDSTIIVAIDADSDEPAGFIQLYPAYSATRLKPSWILTDIYVATAHRGKGVARGLLQAASDYALKTGASPFTENVAEDAPVRQLFDSLGHRAADWMMHYTIDL